MRPRTKLRMSVLALVLRTMSVNRKRCFFAVLGIIVGITAVTTIASLGYSAQRALSRELEKLGTNLVIIEAARSLHGRGAQGPIVKTLTENDITVLQTGVNGIAAAAPVLLLPGNLTNDAGSARTDVVATRAEFMQVRGENASSGRFFSPEEDAAAGRVILLGQTVADLLFGGSDPVGETVALNGISFEVIGILAEKGLDADGEDRDDFAIIPLTAARRHLGSQEHLTHIYIEAAEAETIPALKEDIAAALRAAHKLGADEPDDFNVLDQAQLLAARTDVLGSVEDLINIMAIITLLAGGLGITAVQLISIRERTWEIGLHRAVGASKTDITMQFIFESSLLGGAGGLVGAVLGVIVPLIMALAFSLTPAIAWPVLILSLTVSVMIGLAAGIYPALYAARLDPVAALRSA